MKKTTFLAARLSAVLALALFASIAHAQDTKSSQKEEKNRNVMLNAASANGPREIQIGLPSADVNVLENGLPVTYATNPHSVNANWRSDASLSHVGLLKISETAITTGNIGYAVNSFTQLGQEGFHGRLDYKANHFGLNESISTEEWAKAGITAPTCTKTSIPALSISSRVAIKTARKSTKRRSLNAMTAIAVNLRRCIAIRKAIPSTVSRHNRLPSSMLATVA